MKKLILYIIMLAILACLLSGCAAAAENRITPVTLTDREKMLVSATSQKTFVIDFQVDESYTWVTLSLEEYRLGQKVDAAGASLSFEVDQKGTFVLSLANVGADAPGVPQKCTLFVSSVGGWSSQILALDDISEEGLHLSSGDMAEASTLPSGSMALACIRYTKGDSMGYPSQEFYLDPDNHLDEIKEYDLTYVLKCKFLKEIPE